jgi:hypothetical protein
MKIKRNKFTFKGLLMIKMIKIELSKNRINNEEKIIIEKMHKIFKC